MLVAVSSPVEFSRSVFFGVKFRVVTTKTISVSHCKSFKIRLSYCELSGIYRGNS